MTLKGKRLQIVIAAAIALVIVLPLAATAAAPYSGNKPVTFTAPSPTGTADATATGDPATGILSVSASVNETLPFGWPGSMVGTDTAVGDDRITALIPVSSAGTYAVTVTMQVTQAQAQASLDESAIPALSGAASQVVALAGMAFAEGGGSSDSAAQLVCAPGFCPATQTVTLTKNISAPGAGNIYVETGLQSLAYTQGAGAAAASATATISDIVVGTPGPPPPPVGQVQEFIEVLRDTVSVDSRSAGAVSHINLEEGKKYAFEALGTFSYTLSGDLADAECSTYGADTVFKDGRHGGGNLLDLLVDGGAVQWTPASADAAEPACSTNHTYTYAGPDANNPGIVGANNALLFSVNDPDGLNDNFGSLTVHIYELVPEPVNV